MSRIKETASAVGMQDRLLDAAEKVVARDGVANLTLEAVAREAGVSKGGLLYHFPSKSALVGAVVERLATHCEADQNRAANEGAGRPGCFARAYIAARAEPFDPKEEPIHTALLAAAGTDPHYLEPFRKRSAEWQARLENDGIDPVTACIVKLAMDGMCLGRLLGLTVPEGEMRKKLMERLEEMTREHPNSSAAETAAATLRASSGGKK